MKPVIVSAFPPTMIVPPFMSMPVRAPTSPLMTRSPPRRAAPARDPAFFSMRTTPDIMFSATAHPTRPVMCTSGPVDQPAPEVAEAALEGQPTAGQDADAE
jgi:hypothetical protein